MKTISVAVSEGDYEAFRESALAEGRSIALLIREAMALYREQRLDSRTRMLDIPVLLGHRPILEESLPAREALYDEIFAEPSRQPAPQRDQAVHEPKAEYGDGSK